MRAARAEEGLAGQAPSEDAWAAAGADALADLDPPADLHGSADYRRKVAAVLVRRGLQAAADDAHGRQ